MIRQPKREQINRLMVKTLDQVFITRAREGLSCSLFEADALTELVNEVNFPWFPRPEQTGRPSAQDAGPTPVAKSRIAQMYY